METKPRVLHIRINICKLSDHEEHCAWSCAHMIYVTANCPHTISLFSEAAWQSHELTAVPQHCLWAAKVSPTWSPPLQYNL